eukprot:1497879-Ditylum_brightwellii.AAC.1
MRMVPTKHGQGNKDVEQLSIPFQRPTPKLLKCGQFQRPTNYVPPPQMQRLLSTSYLYLSLIAGPRRSGS